MVEYGTLVAYIGTTEILIIAGILVLIFGGAKLPQLARGMGEAIRELRHSATDDGKDDGAAKPAA
ncbi:MAG TPA: twin-arginine translocase TatA/TatE family subunit [Armatimonadaceae bacterium]|nr:twin-arginine translocase TatA/TatE family subunit [Armatimonadaceae bacterium]